MSTVPTLIDGRRHRRQLLVLLGVALLVVMQLLVYQLWSSYQEAMHEAEIDTRNYAAIFETRLDATLRRTETVMEALVRRTPICQPNFVEQFLQQHSG